MYSTSQFCIHMFRQGRGQCGISKIRDTGLWIIIDETLSKDTHDPHRFIVTGLAQAYRREELKQGFTCSSWVRLPVVFAMVAWSWGVTTLYSVTYQLSACISTIPSVYYLGTNLCIRKKLRTMKLLKLLKNWKSQNRSGTIRKKTSKKTPPIQAKQFWVHLIEMRNPQVGDHQDSYVFFFDFI